jgi:hypothetical protein
MALHASKAAQELEIRIAAQAQPRQKSSQELISANNKLGMVAHIRHLSYAGSINKRTIDWAFRP